MDRPVAVTSEKKAFPARRGRRKIAEGAALDRERLFATLLEMAREEGLASLNFRSVARRLAVSPRLLYRHVRDKEDMLSILTDEMLAESMPDLAEPSWEGRLRNIARTMLRIYRTFPGSAIFILSRSANQLDRPHALAVREALYAAFADAGLGPVQSQEMLVSFSVVVLGNVVVAESLTDNDARLAIRRPVIEAAFERGVAMLIDAVRKAAAETAS